MAALPLLMLFACLATVALPSARAADDQGCEDGWSRFGSRCFKFFPERRRWADAEKSCHDLGANLPSIHSAAENAFIVGLTRTSTGYTTYTWIGGSDSAQEGQWLWSDGTLWDYTYWLVNEPANHGGVEHCLAFWNGDFWNDYTCANTLSYTCSKDPPLKPVSGVLTLEGYTCQCTPTEN